MTVRPESSSQRSLRLDSQFAKSTFEIERRLVLLNRHTVLRVRAWLRQLSEAGNNATWKAMRNEYAALLLLQLKQGALREPFDRQPADGPLRNLSASSKAQLQRFRSRSTAQVSTGVTSAGGGASRALAQPPAQPAYADADAYNRPPSVLSAGATGSHVSGINFAGARDVVGAYHAPPQVCAGACHAGSLRRGAAEAAERRDRAELDSKVQQCKELLQGIQARTSANSNEPRHVPHRWTAPDSDPAELFHSSPPRIAALRSSSLLAARQPCSVGADAWLPGRGKIRSCDGAATPPAAGDAGGGQDCARGAVHETSGGWPGSTDGAGQLRLWRELEAGRGTGGGGDGCGVPSRLGSALVGLRPVSSAHLWPEASPPRLPGPRTLSTPTQRPEPPAVPAAHPAPAWGSPGAGTAAPAADWRSWKAPSPRRPLPAHEPLRPRTPLTLQRPLGGPSSSPTALLDKGAAGGVDSVATGGFANAARRDGGLWSGRKTGDEGRASGRDAEVATRAGLSVHVWTASRTEGSWQQPGAGPSGEAADGGDVDVSSSPSVADRTADLTRALRQQLSRLSVAQGLQTPGAADDIGRAVLEGRSRIRDISTH